VVDPTWFQRLNVKYDEPVSNFAFNFNLRHYSEAAGKGNGNGGAGTKRARDTVGWCRLTTG